MTNKSSMGRWTALFGAESDYATEIMNASTIASRASVDGDQMDLMVDESLQGWEDPLWGADRDWLYLRRPEGVWKTRIPRVPRGAELVVWARDPNAPEKRLGISLGDDISPTGGWRVSRRESMSPQEMDSRVRPRGIVNYPFDELGPPLINVVSRQGANVWIEAGSAFGSPPSLRREGAWIVGTDSETGRTVGFAVPSPSEAEMALDHGQLWLRFGGSVYTSVEAPVI